MNEITQLRPNPIDPEDLTSFENQARAVLSSLARHDEATRSHSDSVVAWSRKIARDIGLSAAAVTFTERCALLHDIGKVFTPRNILTKPGPLTADEWIRMKAHVAEGAALLQGLPMLAAYAAVVRAHHEHYDGRGYPQGLAGDAIPRGARIIAVADAFDAMIGTRCYRPALAPDLALKELRRCRGSQFEPAVVDSLVSMILPARRMRMQRALIGAK